MCANLEAYHHRDLDADERTAFEAHLPGCAACRTSLESLRGMDDHLRDALSPSWDDLSGRIRARIEAGTSRTTRMSTVPDRKPLYVGLAAAAAIIVCALYVFSRPKEPVFVSPPTPVSQAPAPVAPPLAPAPVVARPVDDEFAEPPAEKPAPASELPAPPPAVAPPAPVPVVPAPAPGKPAPSSTVAVRARVQKGKVYLSSDETHKAIADVLSGQEIVAESAAIIAQADETRLEVVANSRLAYPDAKPVHLADGAMTVERSAAEEAACTTPQAEVRVQSGRFSLTAKSGSTRMMMVSGAAKFLSVPDGVTKQLRAGQMALAPLQVDPKRIDEAIKKGVEFLKTSESIPAGFSFGPKDSDELILLTYAHAGLTETDPKVQELVAKVLDGPLESTYEVSLLAMALEELNRVKYQLRIWQCAQFLVDNQCKNGQWSYGKPTAAAMDTPTGVPPATATGGPKPAGVREFSAPGQKEKPKVVRKIPVRRTRDGIAGGDNSNSQYAALGLRACAEAGILIPKEVLTQARQWWHESQIGTKDASVSTGKITGVPQGWCYRGYHHDLKYCKNPDTAYASMTAGGVGALAILDSLLGMDWKKDKAVMNGLAWLAKNWSWTENIGPSEIGGGAPKSWLLYHFYAVERMGMLLDIPKVGDNDWYLEGGNILLDSQKPTGAWMMSANGKPLWDTCFAILFLKRATKPLDVASEDRKPK
jgi:hypothetical protein